MTGTVGWFWGLLAQAAQGGAAEQDVGAAWNAHMLEEVSDAHHFPVPFLGTEIQLPEWPPLHIGSLTVDLSPTKHVIWLLIAATLCGLAMIWVARRTHGRGSERAPKGLANVIEAFVIYLRDEVAMRNIGKGGERYVPFVLTVFFFILIVNLLGLVPFGATATGNISVTAALALLSLIVIEVGGLLHLGPVPYLRTIVYVPEGLRWYMQIPMAVIMTPVEAIAKLARIFALAVRLFANMTAGHFVILALLGLIFLAGASASAIKWVVWVGPVLMAVGIMLLEILVALLQAYIFTMLTSVFIGLVRHAH
ncbi:MAG: F0F1 ATP synthase subunit A [Gemmatimonadota bacterium]|nr:MAG: F0F1 ATP synthase subunit A [Gemmatimonadota bacterium]